MKSLQEEILELLDSQELEVDKLLNDLKELHDDLPVFDLRSALLPLMSTGLVEWTKNGNLRASKSLVTR